MGTMRKACLLLSLIALLCACDEKGKREVIIYTSLDQVFSEPILQKFEEETGISVRAVYDTEAAKTTGLVNRLIAEGSNPQADVFWNSEVGRTIILKKKGILTPYRSPSAAGIPPRFRDKDSYWTGFAARARILICNTNLVSPDEEPRSIFGLTDAKWKGEVALANPLFGTTATHVAALFIVLGDQEAKAYFESLKNNDVVIVPGNSTSRDRVRDGESKIGFTDTDDANIAILEKKPVKMIFPDADGIGTLLIPNTVALVKDGPNPDEGKQLIDYLLSKQIESALSFSRSAQIPLRRDTKKPDYVPCFDSIRTMQVDYEEIAERMEETGKFLQELFIR
jgi:iron(III) transport system substrate-binding protein